MAEERVRVPELKGLRVDHAVETLRDADLRPGLLRFELTAELEAGLVIGQDPAPGETVPPGTRVRVTVSSGWSEPPTGSA
jgi:beta-lactam-binding protein with PASTA domain